MKNLFEALGVPENLHETSVKVYDRLIKALKRGYNDGQTVEYDRQFKFKGEFRISDYKFSNIQFQVNIFPHPMSEEFELVSMSVSTKSMKTPDNRLKLIKSKTIDLNLQIAVPNKSFVFNELIIFLEKNKNELISSISHELMHAYDNQKKEYESLEKRASYNAVAGKGFGIPTVDKFLHDLYFITTTENLVRPSEIWSGIKNNEISQENFLDFLKKHDTYVTLKRISQFNLKNFKKELKKEIPKIDEFLKKHTPLDVKNMSEIKKINEILRLIWVNVTHWIIIEYKKLLSTHFLEEIMGFQGEKERIFNRFVKRQQRFSNYNEFFAFYENLMNKVAFEMMKKVAKLYAMTPR